MNKPIVQEKKQLDPKEYNQILRGVKLTDIRLINCSAAANKENPKEMAAEFELQEMRFSIQNKNSTVYADLRFQAKEESEDEPVVTINARFSLSFNSDEELTSEFMEIFTKVTVPITIWPYCRELVANILPRMGFPPAPAPLLINLPKGKKSPQ